MLADLPLAQLRSYRPEVTEPADFAEFWAEQLRAAPPAEPEVSPAEMPLRHADVFDVTFAGHGGDPVKAWLLVPHRAGDGALVVEYVGYGGGRGHPFDWLRWSCAGHPHLVMDCRGQGGGWRSADTPDRGDEGGAAGFLTRGIADPRRHYYTRLFVDAARAVDAARSAAARVAEAGRPIVTAGASQGGGLAIAAAHLAGGVAAALPEVPFLAHPRRALEVTDSRPYFELAEYCRVYPDKAERAFATLAYLDVVNHARHAAAPALFSVALADDITPPSTVFAAFNHYAGRKDIAVYPYNGHEGGGTRHFLAQLDFLAAAGLA